MKKEYKLLPKIVFFKLTDFSLTDGIQKMTNIVGLSKFDVRSSKLIEFIITFFPHKPLHQEYFLGSAES